MTELRPMSDDRQPAIERVVTRRLTAGGVLCLVALAVLVLVVSTPRDRLISFIPVNATLYVTAKRMPMFFETRVPGDEIIEYIFEVTQERFSESVTPWLRYTALHARRVSFAQFFDANGIATSVLLFDVADNTVVPSDMSVPLFHERIGNIEIIGETQSAIDGVNDVVSKKTLSLVSQHKRNQSVADGEIFIRVSALAQLSGYVLPTWSTTFLPEKNLWLQLSKKSDHWEFASHKPYVIGASLNVSPRRIMRRERVHWYGANIEHIFTDPRHPLASLVRPINDAIVFVQKTFGINTSLVLNGFHDSDVMVLDGEKPAVAMIIPAPTKKVYAEFNELLRAVAAYFNPHRVTHLLPDKTTVTELVVDRDQWYWQDFSSVELLTNTAGHTVLAKSSKNNSVYLADATSTLALLLSNDDSVAWSSHCPVAARSREAIILRLASSYTQAPLPPFQYMAVVPIDSEGVAGCFFNL